MAGAVIGVLVLSLSGWLSGLYALPRGLLLWMGLANLVYAGVSFTLAMRRRGDHVPMLRFIAAANIAWAMLCATWAVLWFGKASPLGVGQFVAEALFVGGLGVLEWRAAGTPGRQARGALSRSPED